ncbi:methylamine utilization protein MauJ [uncultured Acinetobacter sp.]|uniref:methylamine utilization protein MauJ n=1 Tax=uncultured Acinetobacter sp. TaxID=165433 RepID=UPI0025883550|nr:methylamine utilization protein MauJ [uncultured Acinetobacter sp.]
MALNYTIQIEGGKGLNKAVLFTGLSHPMIIHPMIYGEPVLTLQPFYYISDLESVAKIRFKNNQDKLSSSELDYLIDNYLFAYSMSNLDSKLSFKISENKFWQHDANEFYQLVDNRNTEVLVLDFHNDPDVKEVKLIKPEDNIELSDWDIGRNTIFESFRKFINDLDSNFEKKVFTFIEPNNHRDGYMGKMRIIKPSFGLITYSQAIALEDISIDMIKSTDNSIKLHGESSPFCDDHIGIERITTNKLYSPLLLSYYFSGLKEKNPLKSFLSFYNVLEYYFEEAPILLGDTNARTEKLQLTCVIKLLNDNDHATLTYFNSLPNDLKNKIQSALSTSTSVDIEALNISSTDFRGELANWLYNIRCAVVHSKKTRRGNIAAQFEPYSEASKNIHIAIPLIKWLAILCIEKDYELNNQQNI